MSNMSATDKKKVGLLVRIRSMAKVDHLAKLHKLSRNAEVERIFSEVTKDVELTDEELEKARAEEDKNRAKRGRGKGAKEMKPVKKVNRKNT